MKKIFLIAFALLTISSKAQTNLGMSQYTPNNLVDTVFSGTSSSYSVWVINHGPTTFKDTLHVYTAVRDSANGATSYLVGAYTTPDSMSIPANDSVQIPLTGSYNVSPTGYKIGIDVIVVWPVAASATTVDSLTFNIWIIDANGVNEIDLERFIKVFPNPTTENISIGTNSNITVEVVKILDGTGKLVLECKRETVINVKDLAPEFTLLMCNCPTKNMFQVKLLNKIIALSK